MLLSGLIHLLQSQNVLLDLKLTLLCILTATNLLLTAGLLQPPHCSHSPSIAVHIAPLCVRVVIDQCHCSNISAIRWQICAVLYFVMRVKNIRWKPLGPPYVPAVLDQPL